MMKMSRVVLLGTGPSTCVPNLGLACDICQEASDNRSSKNRRRNPCLLIQYAAGDDTRNIIIDCGKTFRDQVETFFPKFGVKSLDAVILTHDHADAVLGLDDLRDVQKYERRLNLETAEHEYVVETPMQVLCSDQTFHKMQTAFPYLTSGVSCPPVPPASEEDSADGPEHHMVAELPDPTDMPKPKKEPSRHISKLDWRVIANLNNRDMHEDPPFCVADLEIKPVRVEHGGTYIALGFVFGQKNSRVAYLSDLNAVPPATMAILKQEEIDVLVVDALFVETEHTTHFSMPKALDCIRELKPKRAFLTGMSHEFDYYKLNDELAALKESEGICVEMGYDGLALDVNL